MTVSLRPHCVVGMDESAFIFAALEEIAGDLSLMRLYVAEQCSERLRRQLFAGGHGLQDVVQEKAETYHFGEQHFSGVAARAKRLQGQVAQPLADGFAIRLGCGLDCS